MWGFKEAHERGSCRSKGRRAHGASWLWLEASTRPPTLARAPPSLEASLVASRYSEFHVLHVLLACGKLLSGILISDGKD